MIDGKMQDDATWKQCKVMVTLAEMLAKKDPELAKAYELEASSAEPPSLLVRDHDVLLEHELVLRLFAAALHRDQVVDRGDA